MKLQINSLAALERLIGGDTAVEIEIRNNIVQEFTKKHLKGVATERIVSLAESNVKTAAATIAKEAATQALDKLGMFSGNSWSPTFVIKSEVKASLRDAAVTEVDAIIRDAVKAAVAKYGDAVITARVNRLVDDHINARISDGVNTRLKEIANKLK